MASDPSSLEELVRAFADPGADRADRLGRLVAGIRPRSPTDVESPSRSLQALAHILENQPGLRSDFRRALMEFFSRQKAVSFFADAGMFPNRGFFAESLRRISRSLLPDDSDTDYLKDVVNVVFDRAGDARWIAGVPDHVWWDVLFALHLDDPEARAEWQAATLVEDLLEALRVVSYRIAAIGLEPELLRLESSLENFESPFLAQNPELLRYLSDYRAWWLGKGSAPGDARHVRVLFDQGRTVLKRVRARASREGTSLSLTLLLRRIGQHLNRCEALLAILEAFEQRRSVDDAVPSLTVVMKGLVADECRKDDLLDFWRSNIDILARRVTDNAGRTGEHYITSSRSEFFATFRSAALGGFIIAIMALAKIFITGSHLAPLTEALAVCLNYGIGFVIIHVLRGTVATKQPAMTAATIAASIDTESTRQRNLDHLATLIARASRSQLVAILGNVVVAVPTAILVGTALTALGHPYPDAEKAAHLLSSVHPWLSGSLAFAAIAGVCLFLTGLISGYYDNLAAYNRIPQRLMALKWPSRIIGQKRWNRVGSYIENNLGALAGNFFFGFLLGGVTAFGVLFGLPVDVRHVAFSAAYLGYGIQALHYAMPWQEIAIAASGVTLIGLVNLVVSFSLSLRVAARARQVKIPRVALLRTLFASFARRPREFFLPPPVKEKVPPALLIDDGGLKTEAAELSDRPFAGG